MREFTKRSWVPLVLALLIAFNSSYHVRCERLSECAADSCIACFRVEADCNFNNATNTLHCQPNISRCSLKPCEECEFCTGTVIGSPSQEWTLTSDCFRLDNPICSDVTDQCIISENITNSVLMANIEGDNDFTASCMCNGENCTQEFVLSYSIIPEQPTPSPSGTPTVTPAVSDIPPATNSTLVIIMAIIGTILLVVIVVVCAVIAFYARNYFKSTPRSRQNRQRVFENGLSEQHQPLELLELIGQGHYGSIWRAECSDQEREVAVKIFNTQNRGSWENERHLYAMESTTHRNVLEFVSSESRGTSYDVMQYYMVTRYYPLGSLSKFLRSHPVSWKQTCRMVHSIASGLTHLHSEDYTNSSGIVAEKYPIAHRDIKSANVLVRDEDGDCVLGDLGLALILDPSVDSKQLANSGQVGTFRYMAPEALDARVNLHNLESFKQIDVYALALVIWEIMWRCKLQEEEDIPSYQPPLEEYVVRKRPSGPSLEDMKDIVVTRILRPTIPSCWRTNQALTMLVETIEECWDADPEARLSAANVQLRMEDLLTTASEGGREAGTAGGMARGDSETGADIRQPSDDRNIVSNPRQPPYLSSPPTNGDPLFNTSDRLFEIYRHPDTRPPPYSRLDTHARPGNSNRPYFQTSMPHIVGGGGGYDAGRRSRTCQPPPRPAQSLRNCALPEGQVIELSDLDTQERAQPGSVRNSLILGTGDDGDTGRIASALSHPPPSASSVEANLHNVHETVQRSRSDSHTHTGVMSESRSSQISSSDSGFQNSHGRRSNVTSNVSENSCFLSSFEVPAEVQSESSTSTIEAGDTHSGLVTGSSVTTTV